MPANSVVRARINEDIKKEASIVLESMGLTVSDAFRMLLTRIANEHALPFEPLVPNKTTINAIKEAKEGKLSAFNNLESLMDDLNADN